MPKTSSSHIYASAWAAVAVIVLVVVLTIVGELYAPLKNFLKDTFSHHWLGKSILSILLYGVLLTALSFRKVSSQQSSFALTMLGHAGIIGTLLLTGFFIGHALHLL